MTIAEIQSIRKKRLSLQREADLLEQQEKGLIGDLIQHMNASKLEVFKEGEDEAVLVASDEPNVEDWPKLLDHILATGSIDLLQKRVTASAVKARWKDDQTVPGIAVVTKQSLKFNV